MRFAEPPPPAEVSIRRNVQMLDWLPAPASAAVGELIIQQQGMMAIKICSEEAADAARIREVTELAFREAAHTCRREHLIVEELRESGALILSLAAVSDLGIVGHVTASPVIVSNATGEWFGIGPISVVPPCQRQGIGSRLMDSALLQMAAPPRGLAIREPPRRRYR